MEKVLFPSRLKVFHASMSKSGGCRSINCPQIDVILPECCQPTVLLFSKLLPDAIDRCKPEAKFTQG